MKTYAEINEKIRKGRAVVVTAEEIIDIVDEKGAAKAAEEVDVVTTGTFGPMCSSGAFLNIGHTNPKMKIQKAWLNDVSVYCGLAAVDVYVGATEMRDDDPLNKVFPGTFKYGGAHVIEDLIAGKDVELRAIAYGTDCYPRKELDTYINIADLNEAFLTNPRNAYQNYNVAVNAKGSRAIYTYMGMLKPDLGNANYCSAGQLSPLLNDPHYRTIGIGTRIFMGGGVGHVFSQGTQHNPGVPRSENGVVKGGAGTLAIVGDMKQMTSEWVVGASFIGYGVSLAMGLGIPIPMLDEEMARYCAVKDSEIFAPVVDYSQDYPNCVSGNICEVSYAELKSGTVQVNGRDIPTASLSSYPRAVQIANILKEWIQKGDFLLAESVAPLPPVESGYAFRPLKERPIDD